MSKWGGIRASVAARAVASAIAGLIGLLGWIYLPERPWPALYSMERGAADSRSPLYLSEFIFEQKPGQSCHVASVVTLEDGSLLASWYAGSREGARDVAIYLSRRDAAGLWSAPRAVMNQEMASEGLGLYVKKVGNALLARDAKNRLWLFYVTISAGGWSGSTLNAMHSMDGGKSWSKSKRLHLGPFFNLTNNIKNKPVLMDDGSLLIPAYHEFARKYSEAVLFYPSTYKVRKARMTDTGRLIQPGFAQGLEHNGKKLVALMRNMDEGFAMRVESADSGRTWSEPRATDLPNPNSGLDIISLSDGRLLAAANDLPKGRHRLSLLVSSDRGMSWQRAAIVQEGPEGAEYSYPFLARGTDGMLHLVYTHERRRIRHIAFNEAWLQEGLK